MSKGKYFEIFRSIAFGMSSVCSWKTGNKLSYLYDLAHMQDGSNGNV